jgi:hypothetical protein
MRSRTEPLSGEEEPVARDGREREAMGDELTEAGNR